MFEILSSYKLYFKDAMFNDKKYILSKFQISFVVSILHKQ